MTVEAMLIDQEVNSDKAVGTIEFLVLPSGAQGGHAVSTGARCLRGRIGVSRPGRTAARTIAGGQEAAGAFVCSRSQY